eukprot:TRINITY_DN112317_c0_g1_i1.p1 TRINITY_DN112317_c0_g1~~TRINITY_DN112317_c0_g1_i1.p1  ORF type:complete len:187 (-),score=13.85 TRINITY_DN112317_c0_g1_i1:226-786(-)
MPCVSAFCFRLFLLCNLLLPLCNHNFSAYASADECRDARDQLGITGSEFNCGLGAYSSLSASRLKSSTFYFYLVYWYHEDIYEYACICSQTRLQRSLVAENGEDFSAALNWDSAWSRKSDDSEWDSADAWTFSNSECCPWSDTWSWDHLVSSGRNNDNDLAVPNTSSTDDDGANFLMFYKTKTVKR